jgi:hypothetical protein
MKKLVHLNIIIVFLFIAISHTPIVPDVRVIDYLGKEKVDFIQKNNPELIRYYNFFLDNAYAISTVPSDKLADNNFPTLSLPIKNGKVDTKSLNILKLNIQRKFDEAVYFKIKNSNEIIVFLSEKDFMVKYNKHREELGLIKK